MAVLIFDSYFYVMDIFYRVNVLSKIVEFGYLLLGLKLECRKFES